MSMFSQHFLIHRRIDNDCRYWNGGDPHKEESWVDGGKPAVLLFDRTSADMIVTGLMKSVPFACFISEDE